MCSYEEVVVDFLGLHNQAKHCIFIVVREHLEDLLNLS